MGTAVNLMAATTQKAGDWGMKCRVQPPPKPETQKREWPLPCKKSSSCHFIGRTSITFLSLVAKKFGKFTFQPSDPCNIKEILKIMGMNSGCQKAISSPWSRPDDFVLFLTFHL